MSASDLLITLTARENDSNNVTLAFTIGEKALEQGHSVDLMLMSEAVYLAEKDYADKIDIGEPFEPVKDVLPRFLEKGGNLIVCSACMIHNDVDADNLIDGVTVITGDDVVGVLMNAKKTFQLN